MAPPSLRDNTADVDRLIKGIRTAVHMDYLKIDLPLLKRIPSLLRKYNYDVLAVIYEGSAAWHLVDVFPSQDRLRFYGLAVDLGTSRVVMRLLDLSDQEMRGEGSFINPQGDVGPDILTRIHFASQEGGLPRLQALLIKSVNGEILGLSQKYSIPTDFIVGMSVAGNTTMAHLFLGLDPKGICREPYIPALNRPDLIKSADLGLTINSGAPVFVLPNVGSYLGGDVVAGILASGMTLQEEVSVLVDMGTNAEVVIGNSEWLVGCAGAAGPALEGGVVSMGMMAGPGVIDKVAIDPRSGNIHIRTIENRPPVGICGSGLIDLVAQLYLAGMIDLRGKYVLHRCGERLKDIDGSKHLVVVSSRDSGTGEDLTLSQTDIDALIRSKAAMYAILGTLADMLNLSLDKVRKFYIAGTFGTYVDPRSAITLGLLPDIPLDVYEPLGNTSLAGASLALLSAASRDEIYRIRDRITYVELNVNQEFMNLFNAAKFIPHTDRSRFPSVRQWD